MQNWRVDASGDTAERMIQRLAGVCNGASSWDGAGFSKMDTEFGHSLAQRAAQGRAWSEKQAAAALKLINKYRKQLGGAAYVQQWLMNPVFAMMPLGVAAVGAAKMPAQSNRTLASQDKTAVFRFSYNMDIVSHIKQIRGEHKGVKFWATWHADSKSWHVPVNEASITPIMTLARDWEFEIEPRFETYYSQVQQKLSAVVGAAEESKMAQAMGYEHGVNVQADMLVIQHDNPQVLAEFQAALEKLGD